MKSMSLIDRSVDSRRFLPAGQTWAANPIKDGSTLQLGSVTYRLDGIDTPALDQACIDEHADPDLRRSRRASN